MATVMINNKIYSGRTVQVAGNKIFINGEEYHGDKDEKKIEITIAGDIDVLDVDMCEKIHVTGNVNKIKTSSGDVIIDGSVNGGVQTSSGDVECADIGGDVQTSSGDIKAGNVTGKVKTMSGDIKYRK